MSDNQYSKLLGWCRSDNPPSISEVETLLNQTYVSVDSINLLLIVVAEQGYLELVKYLVEKRGAQIRPYNYDYMSISRAVLNNHLAIVKYLVEKEPSFLTDGDTAFLIDDAVTADSLDTVKYLLSRENVKWKGSALVKRLKIRTKEQFFKYMELRAL